MTITLEVRPEVEAELARRAAIEGRDVETYAASLLEHAVRSPTAAKIELDRNRARAAAARIREIRKGLTLKGATIRELIDEGRP